MLFDDLAAASVAMAATSRRTEKVRIVADLLRRVPPDEIAATVAMLAGEPPQGRVGVGWSTVAGTRAEPASHPSVHVAEVEQLLEELLGARGAGSVAQRRRALGDLLGRCVAREQDLLRRLLTGELRHGALEAVVAEAVAVAAGLAPAEVRRGAMLGGSLPAAAVAALTGGADALGAITLEPLRPVQPMLAAPAADVGTALALTGLASVEWKLDGARVQAHRVGDEVRLFTRNLNDVTERLGGIVAAVRAMPVRDVVLDGEALGIDDAGAPRRFQDTMGDFGAEQAGRGAGLAAFFFDVLHLDGAVLIDQPWTARRAALDMVVPASMRMPSIVTSDVAQAEAAQRDALGQGHEGVVVKAVGSPYEAGRRGGAWRKVKPVHTVDLVVLAAEWGSGRRRGWLSNLHLGALASDGTFVMVGKTFKGLTDELLAWQTGALQAIAIGAEGAVVRVRPELVVEIALDGVQASRRYAGGVAVRFARVRRYRPDKSPSEADTIELLQAMLR